MRTTATGAFFTTSPYLRSGLALGETTKNGSFEIHGKAMGTSVTLCGMSTYTWIKLWDVPFARAGGARCEGCVEAMSRRAAESPEGRMARR